MTTADAINVQTSEMVSIEELHPHPRNYRTHPDDQLEHLAASIREHGFYRNVVATRDGTVLAGHGVVEASRLLGLAEIPVIRLDIDADDRRATKIMAADNTVSHLAEDDDRVLTELLKELSDADDLLGTGYDEQMLAALAMVTRPASELADFDAAAEWVGMPSFGTATSDPLKVIVSFETPEDRASFFDALGAQPPSETTKSIWWPMKVKDDVSSIAFVATDDGGEAA
jgi:hypothetical protein